MKTLTTIWRGIRPLLMHSGQLCDPNNRFVRRKREITSKGSKKLTDADYEERDRIEWEGCLYWDETHGPVIPSDNIERCIQQGAMKSRIGKDVAAAVFCSAPMVKLQYDGPRRIEQLYTDSFTLRKAVVIQRSRVMSVRPMFPVGWWLNFDVEYDETILNPKALIKAMVDAGSLIGLGDWRPKFGRFLVEMA